MQQISDSNEYFLEYLVGKVSDSGEDLFEYLMKQVGDSDGIASRISDEVGGWFGEYLSPRISDAGR